MNNTRSSTRKFPNPSGNEFRVKVKMRKPAKKPKREPFGIADALKIHADAAFGRTAKKPAPCCPLCSQSLRLIPSSDARGRLARIRKLCMMVPYRFAGSFAAEVLAIIDSTTPSRARKEAK